MQAKLKARRGVSSKRKLLSQLVKDGLKIILESKNGGDAEKCRCVPYQ